MTREAGVRRIERVTVRPMPVDLAQALDAPGLPNTVICDLACLSCSAVTSSSVRGIAVTANLYPLGDLRCSSCRGTNLSLLPDDLQKVLGAMRSLLKLARPLPQATDAFLRGGNYLWLGKSYEDPRELRDDVEAAVKAGADDASTQLRASGGMVQLRDYVRALELARKAHELAPAAGDPPLLVAEVAFALGRADEVERFARAALARRDGPLLVLPDRERLVEGATALLEAGRGIAASASTGTRTASPAHAAPPTASVPGRPLKADDACRCGSGKKYRQCCGALN